MNPAWKQRRGQNQLRQFSSRFPHHLPPQLAAAICCSLGLHGYQRLTPQPPICLTIGVPDSLDVRISNAAADPSSLDLTVVIPGPLGCFFSPWGMVQAVSPLHQSILVDFLLVAHQNLLGIFSSLSLETEIVWHWLWGVDCAQERSRTQLHH